VSECCHEIVKLRFTLIDGVLQVTFTTHNWHTLTSKLIIIIIIIIIYTFLYWRGSKLQRRWEDRSCLYTLAWARLKRWVLNLDLKTF